jgi:hypothetical protein
MDPQLNVALALYFPALLFSYHSLTAKQDALKMNFAQTSIFVMIIQSNAVFIQKHVQRVFWLQVRYMTHTNLFIMKNRIFHLRFAHINLHLVKLRLQLTNVRLILQKVLVMQIHNVIGQFHKELSTVSNRTAISKKFSLQSQFNPPLTCASNNAPRMSFVPILFTG